LHVSYKWVSMVIRASVFTREKQCRLLAVVFTRATLC